MGIVLNRSAVLPLILIWLLISGCISPGSEIRSSRHLSARNDVIIHFIDVGQGDSTFIQSGNGDSVLIDAGSPEGGLKVVSYLQELGVERIDHLIFTHAHDDHMGGIFHVASAFDVRNYYDNGLSNFSSDLFVDYLMTARKDLLRYRVLQAGEVLHAGGTVMEVLNPLLLPSGRLNDDSIVIRMVVGDVRFLFAGDLTERGEKRLLGTGKELSGTILRVGHHGDNDASSEEFLRVVRPEAAIISVGVFNEYGRPHPELLVRLENAGATVYRTDRDGSIVLRTDGVSYSIRTEREGPLTSAATACVRERVP